MNASRQLVLGYGSLAAEHRGCPVTVLRGWRRCWGVAMDNRVDLPGYKFYRQRGDGRRPAVFVCFLDIVPDSAACVTGVCLPVDDGRLRDLDDRERNYTRVDVSDAIADAPGCVWAYVGSAAGRARRREAVTASAVVSRDYLDAAQRAIAVIAPDEAAAIRSALVDEGLAVVSLARVEIP